MRFCFPRSLVVRFDWPPSLDNACQVFGQPQAHQADQTELPSRTYPVVQSEITKRARWQTRQQLPIDLLSFPNEGATSYLSLNYMAPT